MFHKVWNCLFSYCTCWNKIILKMSWDVNPLFIFSERVCIEMTVFLNVWWTLCLFAIEGCPIVWVSRERNFYFGSRSCLNNEKIYYLTHHKKPSGRWCQDWLNQQCNNAKGEKFVLIFQLSFSGVSFFPHCCKMAAAALDILTQHG